jgi:hypothetical protein
MKRVGYLALSNIAVATFLVAMHLPTRTVSAKSASVKSASTVVAEDDVDPEAIDALKKMGTYLHTLKAFQVSAAITRDDVLDDNQQIQYDSQIETLARLPDRLRVEINNARQHRFFFYDGKNFTIFAVRMGYYATVPAPATIALLADDLDDKYDIEVPLKDLFDWGTERAKTSDIKSAMDVGPADVGGVTCEHYAFRQEGLDWQIWIQQGDYALPRRLVLTTLTDESRPQYTAVYTWNLAPSFNDAAFVFEPSTDAQKITLALVPGEKQ